MLDKKALVQLDLFEPKACRICHGGAKVCEVFSYYYIKCDTCKFATPTFHSRERAVETWNTHLFHVGQS